LPEGIDRQAKRGFGMPFDVWLKGPLRDVLKDTLSAGSINNRKLFNVEEVQRIERGFFEGSMGWPQPWLLMMIELWFRKVIDNRSGN
jgi:asparagine synthase (glutamine-hydrolysing)